MRKLFTRDKSKLANVTPASRDVPPDLTSANTTPASDDDSWHVLTNSPRTASPFPGTPPLHSSNNKDTYECDKDRRYGNSAMSILNALSSQFCAPSSPPTNLDVTCSIPDDDTIVYAPGEGSICDDDTIVYAPSESSIHKEKKERESSWSCAHPTDGDDHRRDICEEEDRQDIMRMTVYLIANLCEDWAVLIDLCERISATEANAKAAAKALRREFKYGDAPHQLSATRLWAVMLRNSSSKLFACQCARSKFLDVLKDILTSQRTSPIVRERLLDVLAAATYASSETSHKEESSFRVLWRQFKPAEDPDEGVPLDPDDSMFHPPSPRRSTTVRFTSTYLPVHSQSL